MNTKTTDAKTSGFSAEDLPNRFDFKEAQPRLYQTWESKGYFHAEPDERGPDRRFSIVIPPPNVTGALHLGHALNNTLQDVVVRFKRMQGFNTLWMPGTDHAGIATQAVVERRLKEEEDKTRHDLGRQALVDRIWAWKEQYEARILGQLKQMGTSCDWERTRFTLDDVCATAVRQTFFDLFSKQLIYRGKRLVNWDSFLQTAVSDDEVYRETVAGSFWHYRYPVIDPKPGEPEFVTIATTRPETMLGDTAIAVHPDPQAALRRYEKQVEQKLAEANDKERPSIEQELERIATRRSEMLPQLELLRDMATDGRKVMLPLMDRPIPLVADEWAKPELGSGCVKITPAHDPNDYEVGQRCSLEMINILNPDGTLNSEAGKYAGLTMKKARAQVVEDLETLGLLDEVEDREIEMAKSDRSKMTIEPYLADQWFVRMDELSQSAMDAVTDGRVKIQPERYTKGYLDWLGEKRDWPVSRQLWWGHRIPVWLMVFDRQNPIDAASLPHIESIDIENAEQATPADLAGKISSFIFEGPGEDELTLCSCVAPGNADVEAQIEAAGMVQEDDVLDTWFSSALWPHSTLGWPEKTPELAYYYPTSTLITSRDIITLWVARMVLTGLNNMGEVPFREVYIHPKILDGYGETMSKSKGNGVDPLDVIDKYGADALRFGITHLSTETQDVRMPVQFECPHCESLIDQTKKNRTLPKVQCSKCGKEFSTQWAQSEADKALPRGASVSDKFEEAGKFGNKLWNVSRLCLMNLDGYEAAPLADEDLAFEDRWILSRLATVTDNVTRGLENYKYAEVSRELYDFVWKEFCSVYAEMTKGRIDVAEKRATTQRILAHVLDTVLRLLHPIMPFLTEEIWQLLAKVAPERGLTTIANASESLVIAPWPEANSAHQDQELESQFDRFQEVLGAIREIRSRQQIAPRQQIEFSVSCDDAMTSLLKPMEPFFLSMAKATSVGWGAEVQPFKTGATKTAAGAEVHVDLKDFIDVDAEKARLTKLVEKLEKGIAGKEKKLANENFVSRAPADVVAMEKDSLVEMKAELESAQESLASLG